ncbi:MAG: response regulator transcription factor [Bacillota bacterium]
MSSETIVVIEDEPKLSRLVKISLEAEGFTVFTASDGKTGLKLVEEKAPSLVILDILLPGEMDGFEVARTIRSFSDVPIIILSSRTSESDKLEGFRAGVDDYVTKPFSCPELNARVKALLHRASLAASHQTTPRFTVGDLEVDFAKRRVFLGGNEVQLTQTEYRVLQYLAQNAGKVLLHEEILGRVWGPEYRDEYQYLRNYISNLRRKIEPDPANPQYILSKPGIGYCMRER